MIVSKYFFLLDSFSTKPNNKALVNSFLTHFHIISNSFNLIFFIIAAVYLQQNIFYLPIDYDILL